MIPIAQYVHTIRHLRARQVLGRFRHAVRPLWERPSAFARRPVPPYPGVRWHPKGAFVAAGADPNAADRMLQGSFTFLNDTRDLGWPPRWEEPAPPKLWRYHLHYFGYLWALEYDASRTLVLNWIARYPLAGNATGWESYPLSLRLMNWCVFFFGKFLQRSESDGEFLRAVWPSIHLQAEWLSRHMETHLLGNHLLENAAALALAGSCFGGTRSDRWRRKGAEILEEEIAEQILPDGGHFERSPMYHSRLTGVLEMLLNAGDPELERQVREPLGRMRTALACMCHPDGDIALFNDSAFGQSRHPASLLSRGEGPAGAAATGVAWDEGPFVLRDSGFGGWRSCDGDYVLADAGPVGPDYIPGHAHGDMFSFELSLRGQRVIVDSGVFDYEPGAMRQYCRSTRAHNTVEINGEDQCEFWKAFRVGRRARPRDVTWEERQDGFSVSGWHDGYLRLPGRPRHARRITWHRSGVLMVRDSAASQRPMTMVLRLHLHPDCAVEVVDGHTARMRYARGLFTVCFAGDGRLDVERAFYCPEFGRRIETPCLRFVLEGRRLEAGFCIAAIDGGIRLDLSSGGLVNGTCYPW